MEQTTNIPLEAATDEPAFPSTPNALIPTDQAANLEAPGIPDDPLEAGRAVRHDGWTPERIRIFLTTLSQCGVVSDAARAAGMSVKSAYRFRNRADGRSFHLAWDAALHLGRRRLADVAMSRAMHGWIETIRRDGEVWAERNRYDNRLTMAVLTRLDEKSKGVGQEDGTAKVIAQEFDQFVDIVCGGDGLAAAAFIEGRVPDSYKDEPSLLGRLETYRRHGAGNADEIDVSDLDPTNIAGWTRDQVERAAASGLVDELTPAQRLLFTTLHGDPEERS